MIRCRPYLMQDVLGADKEAEYFAAVDEMAENAFDDQVGWRSFHQCMQLGRVCPRGSSHVLPMTKWDPSDPCPGTLLCKGSDHPLLPHSFLHLRYRAPCCSARAPTRATPLSPTCDRSCWTRGTHPSCRWPPW